MLRFLASLPMLVVWQTRPRARLGEKLKRERYGRRRQRVCNPTACLDGNNYCVQHLRTVLAGFLTKVVSVCGTHPEAIKMAPAFVKTAQGLLGIMMAFGRIVK
jgi:hypothetical protein